MGQEESRWRGEVGRSDRRVCAPLAVLGLVWLGLLAAGCDETRLELLAPTEHSGPEGSAPDAGSGEDAAPAPFVPCAQDSECAGSPEGPRCDPVERRCVACVSDDQCGRFRSICDRGACVECVDNEDCALFDPFDYRPRCLLGNCVQCLTSAHCAGRTPICEPIRNACVQCLDDGDCGGLTCSPQFFCR